MILNAAQFPTVSTLLFDLLIDILSTWTDRYSRALVCPAPSPPYLYTLLKQIKLQGFEFHVNTTNTIVVLVNH